MNKKEKHILKLVLRIINQFEEPWFDKFMVFKTDTGEYVMVVDESTYNFTKLTTFSMRVRQYTNISLHYNKDVFYFGIPQKNLSVVVSSILRPEKTKWFVERYVESLRLSDKI